MRHDQRSITIAFFFLFIFLPGNLYADIDNNYVINHKIAERIEQLKKENGFTSQDFNACQITWSVRKLKKDKTHSHAQPHEVIFEYENQEIIKLTNAQDGTIASIQGLGPHCLEFNNYVYLFLDTSDYETRLKFGLSDLSYVAYSADKGATWSKLISLHQFSTKAKFSLPQDLFAKYVRIFGNKKNHALSIFNLRDETTYLFSPTFDVLKSVSVYNRLSNFNYPTDFHYHKNILYLVRGSCERIKTRIQCPELTYMETSRDFGQSWEKNKLEFIKKSYMLTIDNVLYHFVFKPCSSRWFNVVPGWNRSFVCGQIQVSKLSILGKWEKPKTLIKTAKQLHGIYAAEKPIIVWSDYRFHKRRACGFIPLIGCVDSEPFRGPNVVYAGELDISNWQMEESIIEYDI